MSGRSSANPENLNTFVQDAGGSTTDFESTMRNRLKSYNAFQQSGSVGVVQQGPVEQALPALLGRQRDNETYVALVRAAFLQADGGTIRNGVITVPDAALQAAYESVARANGLDPARFDAVGAPLTVSPVQTGTVPQDSGFVNDPVCTATGHFLEDEEDLVVPARLAVLAWPRRYSSRLLDAGAFGRGWFSWAEVHLTPTGTDLDYRGPDGRSFRLGDDGVGGWVVPGTLGAHVERDGDDLVLVWGLESAWGGQRWRFAADGSLLSVRGPGLGTTTFTSEDGRLVALTHESGRTLTLHWSSDRVTAVACSDGRTVRYRYNGAGDLTAVERPDGGRRYEPDEAGRIVAVRDADDVRLCHNTYDGAGRVVRQVTPHGRETVLEYLSDRATRVSDTAGGPAALYEHDQQGRLTGMVNADGHRFTRTFDERGRVADEQSFGGRSVSIATTAVEDAGDGVVEVAEARREDGTWERWHRDAAGRVLLHERPEGRHLAFRYDGDSLFPTRVSGPLGWSLTYEWADGLPVSVTDADGVRVAFEHDAGGQLRTSTDALGNVTRYEWTRSGRPSRIVYPDGAEATLEWDDAGRLLALTDASGARASFELSPAGRLTAIVDPEGARVELQYGTHGSVERVVDALGRTTEVQIDAFEQLGALTDPGGGKWEVSYSTLGIPSLITAPDGSTWSSTLDPEGRLRELVDPLGHTVAQRYDETGRLVATVDERGGELRYGYDAAGNLDAVTDPLGAVVRSAWDALDRLVQVTDADGVTRERSYTPAGRLAVAREGDAEIHHRYDAAGRLVTMESPEGTWRYEYDARGRVVRSTSPGGQVTRNEYDATGRLTAVHVGAASWTWERDRCGRVVATTDALGATTRYTRDRAGRITAVVDPRGNRMELRYDEGGNLAAVVDPFGRATTTTRDRMRRVTAATDALGRTVRFEHDPNGRLVARTGPAGERTDYTLDPAGDVLAVAVDGTEQVRYERDPRGVLTAAFERATGRRTELAWTPAGRLRAVTNAGRALRYGYDTSGRLAVRTAGDRRETYRYGPDGRLATVESNRYGTVHLGRDGEGRLVRLTADGLERTWSYDEVGRLVGYTQDLGGQRRTATIRRQGGRIAAVEADGAVTTYAYDEGGQLTSVEGTEGRRTYAYDGAGRLVAETGPDGDRRYTYDDAHQLVAITGPAGTTTFTYDDEGRRVRESGPDGDRRFTWDPLGRLRSVSEGGRTTTLDVDALGLLAGVDGTDLWWDPISAISRPLALGDRSLHHVAGQAVATSAGDGPIEWLDADWRGSVAARDEWGRGAARAAGPALGFGGEIELAGLVWLRNRVYDPTTAAFLSPDPLPGLAGTPVAANPYHYAANDPLDNIDPLGLRNQPLSIDDYNAARDRATGVQWGNIAKVGLMAAGVAATILIPGAGLLVGAAIGAGLGAVMGAGPAVIDGITTGNWDVGAIVKGGLTGAIAGGIGGMIPGGGAVLGAMGKFGTRVAGNVFTRSAANGLIGAGAGAVEASVAELYDLTGLPGADGRFDGSAVAQNALIGGAAGGVHGLKVQKSDAQLAADAASIHRAGIDAIPSPGGQRRFENGTTVATGESDRAITWRRSELHYTVNNNGTSPAVRARAEELGYTRVSGSQYTAPGSTHAEQIMLNAHEAGDVPNLGRIGTSREACDLNPNTRPSVLQNCDTRIGNTPGVRNVGFQTP